MSIGILKNRQDFPGGTEVRDPSASAGMQDTQVWSLGQEGHLEEEIATHSKVVFWKIPWTEAPGRPQSVGLDTSEHAWEGKEKAEFSLQILSIQLALPFNPTPARGSDLSYCPTFWTQATDYSCSGHFFARTILKLTNPNLPYFGTTTKENLGSPNHLAFTKQTVLLSLSFGNFFLYICL